MTSPLRRPILHKSNSSISYLPEVPETALTSTGWRIGERGLKKWFVIVDYGVELDVGHSEAGGSVLSLLQPTAHQQLIHILPTLGLPSPTGLSLHLSFPSPTGSLPKILDSHWLPLFSPYLSPQTEDHLSTSSTSFGGLPIVARLTLIVDKRQARWWEAWRKDPTEGTVARYVAVKDLSRLRETDLTEDITRHTEKHNEFTTSALRPPPRPSLHTSPLEQPTPSVQDTLLSRNREPKETTTVTNDSKEPLEPRRQLTLPNSPSGSTTETIKKKRSPKPAPLDLVPLTKTFSSSENPPSPPESGATFGTTPLTHSHSIPLVLPSPHILTTSPHSSIHVYYPYDGPHTSPDPRLPPRYPLLLDSPLSSPPYSIVSSRGPGTPHRVPHDPQGPSDWVHTPGVGEGFSREVNGLFPTSWLLLQRSDEEDDGDEEGRHWPYGLETPIQDYWEGHEVITPLEKDGNTSEREFGKELEVSSSGHGHHPSTHIKPYMGLDPWKDVWPMFDVGVDQASERPLELVTGHHPVVTEEPPHATISNSTNSGRMLAEEVNAKRIDVREGKEAPPKSDVDREPVGHSVDTYISMSPRIPSLNFPPTLFVLPSQTPESQVSRPITLPSPEVVLHERTMVETVSLEDEPTLSAQPRPIRQRPMPILPPAKPMTSFTPSYSPSSSSSSHPSSPSPFPEVLATTKSPLRPTHSKLDSTSSITTPLPSTLERRKTTPRPARTESIPKPPTRAQTIIRPSESLPPSSFYNQNQNNRQSTVSINSIASNTSKTPKRPLKRLSQTLGFFSEGDVGFAMPLNCPREVGKTNWNNSNLSMGHSFYPNFEIYPPRWRGKKGYPNLVIYPPIHTQSVTPKKIKILPHIHLYPQLVIYPSSGQGRINKRREEVQILPQIHLYPQLDIYPSSRHSRNGKKPEDVQILPHIHLYPQLVIYPSSGQIGNIKKPEEIQILPDIHLYPQLVIYPCPPNLSENGVIKPDDILVLPQLHLYPQLLIYPKSSKTTITASMEYVSRFAEVVILPHIEKYPQLVIYPPFRSRPTEVKVTLMTFQYPHIVLYPSRHIPEEVKVTLGPMVYPKLVIYPAVCWRRPKSVNILLRPFKYPQIVIYPSSMSSINGKPGSAQSTSLYSTSVFSGVVSPISNPVDEKLRIGERDTLPVRAGRKTHEQLVQEVMRAREIAKLTIFPQPHAATNIVQSPSSTLPSGSQKKADVLGSETILNLSRSTINKPKRLSGLPASPAESYLALKASLARIQTTTTAPPRPPRHTRDVSNTTSGSRTPASNLQTRLHLYRPLTQQFHMGRNDSMNAGVHSRTSSQSSLASPETTPRPWTPARTRSSTLVADRMKSLLDHQQSPPPAPPAVRYTRSGTVSGGISPMSSRPPTAPLPPLPPMPPGANERSKTVGKLPNSMFKNWV
ncbi:hypothetical protein TREMEDRAFT_59335 [Tremella mesenterica DSM 1558]|uniref:uncharacterized protein n=1 Tax=Tremella mesenterica (strain ATCC 24925 / CBS 8224 / DSM 1558 / NBRC 9311 / NRRL Y-6157 / RJB 2259-6 / UBC 559-6) TaxID=578456 RepID=UPI0003F48F32|nr:uncharacterized protein TREMEDRAFT_59335 [Tremella mesenterica DSM 1558]EIW73172.1 hypothetical protein TREMEDRAFT_59335 [Tremella mesenterica DSM 1558]